MCGFLIACEEQQANRQCLYSDRITEFLRENSHLSLADFSSYSQWFSKRRYITTFIEYGELVGVVRCTVLEEFFDQRSFATAAGTRNNNGPSFPPYHSCVHEKTDASGLANVVIQI